MRDKLYEDPMFDYMYPKIISGYVEPSYYWEVGVAWWEMETCRGRCSSLHHRAHNLWCLTAMIQCCITHSMTQCCMTQLCMTHHCIAHCYWLMTRTRQHLTIGTVQQQMSCLILDLTAVHGGNVGDDSSKLQQGWHSCLRMQHISLITQRSSCFVHVSVENGPCDADVTKNFDLWFSFYTTSAVKQEHIDKVDLAYLTSVFQQFSHECWHVKSQVPNIFWLPKYNLVQTSPYSVWWCCCSWSL